MVLENAHWSSKHKFHIDISDSNGNHSQLPVVVVKGKKKGPVFTIIAGVHGYEYPPIIAAQEMIGELEPDRLLGTVIILPLSNPNSFYGRSPFLNPQDQVNLNRIFPGEESASVTSKIAYFMTHGVIAKSDIVVDIHGGDANEDLLPFVCYYNNEQRPEKTRIAKELSETSGFKHVVSYPYTLKEDEDAKYLFKQAVQDGKIGLSIECGGLGKVNEGEVALIKKALYNMLLEMNMYESIRQPKVDFSHLNKQTYMKSEYKGIFRSSYKAGQEVNKGDVIGSINDVFGDLLTEVVASSSGVILYKIGTPPVNVGETIVCIGYYE